MNLAVIGLGLMGGSLAMAAKKHRAAGSVAGYARRAETRNAAKAAGAVDMVFDTPEQAVKSADLVAICVPVLAVPELTRACCPALRKGAVVTDVGSTKAELVVEGEAILSAGSAHFVGSHPIAGSHEAGFAAARAGLYDGARVIVTPSSHTDPTALATVKKFWASIGARVCEMDPAEHDRVIARTSHLPHLVAAMLVEAADRGEDSSGFFGSGYRDATRIAGGSEEIWHDIIRTNRRYLAEELGEFGRVLARVREMLDRGDFENLRSFLAESRRKRKRMDGVQ